MNFYFYQTIVRKRYIIQQINIQINNPKKIKQIKKMF